VICSKTDIISVAGTCKKISFYSQPLKFRRNSERLKLFLYNLAGNFAEIEIDCL